MKTISHKPTKQRNLMLKAANHEVHRFFTVPLSVGLQEEWGIQRLPLRRKDSVKVVKGEFKGIEGKVLDVDKRNRRITIEECTFEKKNGQTGYIPISVTKVVLTKFADKKGKIDAWREKVMQRKSKLALEGEVRKGEPKKEK